MIIRKKYTLRQIGSDYYSIRRFVLGIVSEQGISIIPTNGSTVSGTILIQATIIDNDGVESVKFSLGNTELLTTTSYPYFAQLDTTIFGNGSYTISVEVTDNLSNITTESVTVIFANTFDAPVTANSMGINLASAGDWERMRCFTDVMKTSRDWMGVDDGYQADLDVNGWPTEDATVAVWGDMPNMNGTYHLSFDGRATVEAFLVNDTIYNVVQTYDPDTYNADLDISNTESTNFELRFTNTIGGIKNVKLLRPISVGSTESYDESVEFTSIFLTAIDPFSAIRYMVFTGANGNQQENWADRMHYNDASYNRIPTGYSYEGIGVPWEIVIKMSNTAQQDAWINVPLLATDDYIQQLAILFRDGNEFTDPLDSNLKLYIEYSNELWNWAPGFSAEQNYNITMLEYASNLFNYDFDGEINDYYWASRRIGRKTVDISNIFRSVFGDSQMMTRIRPVLAWQQASPISGYEGLLYIDGYYGKGLPISYYIYGGGGSAYYAPDDFSSLNALFASMDPDDWIPQLESNIRLATAFGLPRVAYEGGPSLDRTESEAENAIKTLAVDDPRMRTVVTDHHAYWNQYGGDLLMYYDITSGFEWGFMWDTLNPNTQKMAAIADLNESSRESIVFGHSIPSTVDGGMMDIGSMEWWGYFEGSPEAGAWTIYEEGWASYTFNVTSDGTYSVYAVARRTGSVGSILFLIDSNILASDVLSESHESTTHHSVRLSQGLHSVRTKALGGEIIVQSVTMST
jgi:hypothetical protein